MRREEGLRGRASAFRLIRRCSRDKESRRTAQPDEPADLPGDRHVATAVIKNDAYAINGQARHLKTVLYDHRLGDGHERSHADDATF